MVPAGTVNSTGNGDARKGARMTTGITLESTPLQLQKRKPFMRRGWLHLEESAHCKLPKMNSIEPDARPTTIVV